jgi:hypothetical protein
MERDRIVRSCASSSRCGAPPTRGASPRREPTTASLECLSPFTPKSRFVELGRRCGRPPIVSTGMSSLRPIDYAVDVLGAAGCGKARP